MTVLLLQDFDVIFNQKFVLFRQQWYRKLFGLAILISSGVTLKRMRAKKEKENVKSNVRYIVLLLGRSFMEFSFPFMFSGFLSSLAKKKGKRKGTVGVGRSESEQVGTGPLALADEVPRCEAEDDKKAEHAQADEEEADGHASVIGGFGAAALAVARLAV